MEEKTYIQGIYNYCDRWCEKCAFTSNCLLFTNESRLITGELLNEGRRPDLSEIFFKGMDLDGDEETFNDFIHDDDEIEDYEEQGEGLPCLNTPPHRLELLADRYFDDAHTFLNTINDKYSFFPPLQDKLAEAGYNNLFKRFEVISWYHTFIGAKLKRALLGIQDLLTEEDDEVKEFTLKDVNGSAKIAAIGITRSTEALNVLHKELPEYHSEISPLLVMLGEMINEVDKEFPGCREFKRPGFDE